MIIFSFSFFSTLTDCSVSWYEPNILYKYTLNLHRYYFVTFLEVISGFTLITKIDALTVFFLSAVHTEASFRANIELVSEHSRIFSGERARLRCSIPDVHRSNWTYLWFRGSEELSQTGEELNLWNTKVQDSGKYYCQGTRNTKVGKIRTQQSVPVELKVDGKICLSA